MAGADRSLAMVRLLGVLLFLFGPTFLFPLGWSLWADDGHWQAFAAGAGVSLGAGCILWVFGREQRSELQPRDACLLVVAGWCVCTLLATIPFRFLLPETSVLGGLFEAMAGLTTTGATVLTALERLPQSLHIWRSLLQWIGGLAIIVMAVAVLPMVGVGGMQLYRAEAPGPMKAGQIGPRIVQAARALWLVYLILTVGCLLALRGAGMSWFDAVCHALTTVSLGGFSTRDHSIEAFASPAIECVLMAFMTLGALNFATHFHAFHHRSPRAYWRDSEALAVVTTILASTAVLAAFLLWRGVFEDDPLAWRHAAFQVISLATTTGFSTLDWALWPSFASMWLVFLSCVSASAGSTGGGIKMIRTLILVRQTGRELARVVHPRAVVPLRISGQSIESKVVFSVLGFMLLYGATLVTVAFLLMASGLDFTTAVTATLGCLNNVGPGLGLVSPAHQFGGLTDPQIGLLTLTMLAGRLELIILFVLLTPVFWRR
ncbi:MAG: TrkH family potassium uptake protein [Betaproteobacteria bacterium]|jgi:trk system potassium uptake protein TrkH|nr:TrkH family potassium uptake protein [Betaproteobacteria bacterium]NBY18439.1 TrkH family potassium uptake protein [Betaproteobacteria bacterium]